MKTQLFRSAFLLLIFLALPLTTTAQVVDVPDPNLRAAIESALRLAPGDPITSAKMTTLNRLVARNANIGNLSGLDFAINLRWLDLGAEYMEANRVYVNSNAVSDISPLAGLTNLTELFLAGNAVSDISPLAGLINLTNLNLANNMVSDISPLAGLTNLTNLYLAKNAVSDISLVAGLTNLTALNLGENAVSDISPIAGLINLTALAFDSNTISDISPVAGLTSLTALDFQNNTISDMSPIAGLTNLKFLVLQNNKISDTSPVTGLTNLTFLFLRNNTISDISPLVANTGLGSEDRVDVRGNLLNYASIRTRIPSLQKRGVEVIFDNRAPRRIRIVSGNDQEGAPGAALAGPFTVEVQDGNSVAFAGVPVTYAVTAGGGTLSAANATTDANGRAESILTMGPDAETNTVEVSVAGIQEKQIFSAVGIRSPMTLQIISGNDQQGLPGAALEKPFVVEVRDQAENPLPEVQVTFSVSSGGGTLSATNVTTDASGRAESILTLGPNPGTNTVVAAVTGVQAQRTFTAEGVRIPKSLQIISGDKQQGLPGTALEKAFVVEVRDQFDKPLPGAQVTFSVASGGGTLSAITALTDSNGRVESTLTLGQNPGANTVTVSVTGIQEEHTFNAEGIRIPKAFWIISGFDQQGRVGEALANPFIVEVRDQFGEPLPDALVIFSVTSGGGTLSVTTAATGSNGRAESVLTLGPNPGTNTVTVSVTGIPEAKSINVTAEPPPIPEDVNGDDAVNILDLVLVAANLGDEGADLAADVNGDGVVNILDLVVVAGAIGNAAAPSSDPRILAMLTATEVGQWLDQAQTLDLTDATTQMGVLALERLAAALTPEETALLPNYPNPFNPETWIPYQLSRDAEVTLTIHDANGFTVRRLNLGHQLVGYYSDRRKAVHWDGRNNLGERVASGVYFYHLTAGDFSATRKMLILK